MKVSFRDMDIFSKNEEDKDIFFYKNGEEIRDWGYVDPPLVAPLKSTRYIRMTNAAHMAMLAEGP